MGVPRYNSATDGNQKEIVDALRELNFSVAIIREPCDIIVGHGGRNFLFEIKKNSKSKLTPQQMTLRREWKGHFQVVWSLTQILDTILGPQSWN